jgi:hypothetical protein
MDANTMMLGTEMPVPADARLNLNNKGQCSHNDMLTETVIQTML